jgi:hypothetical protein
MPENTTQIILRIPRQHKALFVAASRSAGLTLFAWILHTLATAARSQLPPHHPAQLPPDPPPTPPTP